MLETCETCYLPIEPFQRMVRIEYGVAHETQRFMPADGAPTRQHHHYDCAVYAGILQKWKVRA